ncbi:MAG: hypothetical protein NVSMB16_12270 [Acidimicrobiales bacterium]
MTDPVDIDFSALRALFINCTLKRSPEVSNTQALVEASRLITTAQGQSAASSACTHRRAS